MGPGHALTRPRSSFASPRPGGGEAAPSVQHVPGAVMGGMALSPPSQRRRRAVGGLGLSPGSCRRGFPSAGLLQDEPRLVTEAVSQQELSILLHPWALREGARVLRAEGCPTPWTGLLVCQVSRCCPHGAPGGQAAGGPLGDRGCCQSSRHVRLPIQGLSPRGAVPVESGVLCSCGLRVPFDSLSFCWGV